LYLARHNSFDHLSEKVSSNKCLIERKLENLTAGLLSLKERFCQKKKGKTTALYIGAGNEPLQILGFCNLYQVVDFIKMVM